MKPVYQTKDKKLAEDLKLSDFKYTLKDGIYEFEYTKELGLIVSDYRKSKNNKT